MTGIRCWLVSGLVLVCILGLGCGKGSGTSGTIKVSGKVTRNGAGLPNVLVSFLPAKGRPATGETDANGAFKLTTDVTGDGAVPGKHKVGFSVKSSTIPPMPGTPEAASYKESPLPFPAKYKSPETSGLEYEVKSGGPAADFDLKD